MGISLYGLTPATTYDALIKTGDNAPIDATLKPLSDGVGTNLPMEASTTGINFTGTLLQGGVAVPTAAQVAAKQDTLVSGTNIKTINGTSVLGSGNIVTPSTPPSGVSGAIQFSNGSAFASDATNLFWDDTNKRLGIGTNAPVSGFTLNSATGNPTFTLQRAGVSRGSFYETSGGTQLQGGGNGLWLGANGRQDMVFAWDGNNYSTSTSFTFGASSSLGAKLGIKGSGSTSATTSLLVQNSAGTQLLKIDDGLDAYICNLALGRAYIGQTGGYGGLTVDGKNGNIIHTAANYHSFNTFVGTYQTQLHIQGTQVSVGTVSPNASARFQVDSTTTGFLPPRMTTTQKNAIASPAAGLVVYDSTTNKLCCYNGSTWNDLF